MSSLRQRHREAEIQDQPGLDSATLHQGLRGLERINAWGRSARVFWPAVRELTGKHGAVSVLDLATGAGDVPIALWGRAHRQGLALRVEGCDFNPQAVAYAEEQARRNGADVRFFQHDVVRDGVPDGYDLVICSLFLHHLSEAEAVALLGALARAARHLFQVSDLVRSRSGLALAYLGTTLLARSRINRIDGLRSVRAAFTIEEARGLARQAGLAGAVVEPRWPCRFLLTAHGAVRK
jgi:2-polyprenyl-3-methyl-5-hydroxy-6-metoxy-1,4-benzoquinol methylase